jgi:hypothetical protein
MNDDNRIIEVFKRFGIYTYSDELVRGLADLIWETRQNTKEETAFQLKIGIS